MQAIEAVLINYVSPLDLKTAAGFWVSPVDIFQSVPAVFSLVVLYVFHPSFCQVLHTLHLLPHHLCHKDPYCRDFPHNLWTIAKQVMQLWACLIYKIFCKVLLHFITSLLVWNVIKLLQIMHVWYNFIVCHINKRRKL